MNRTFVVTVDELRQLCSWITCPVIGSTTVNGQLAFEVYLNMQDAQETLPTALFARLTGQS